MGHRHSIPGGFFLILLTIAIPQPGAAAPSSPPADSRPENHLPSPNSVAGKLPIYKLIEGAKGSPYPYTPSVLKIPAGRKVLLKITDHLGGCALVTVFPHMGQNGETVRARVPVGQTRKIVIRVPKPGRYRYHCADNMYFGTILAQ